MSGPDETTDERNRPTEGEKDAWTKVLESMRAIASERRSDGWTTLEIQAGNTVPEPPDAGDSDRFGIVFVIPGTEADELLELLESAEIDAYDVHRRIAESHWFFVTELRDTERRVDILIAGAYDVSTADALAEHAAEVGHVFTHFQMLDGTHLASFRHEDYEKLLPDRR